MSCPPFGGGSRHRGEDRHHWLSRRLSGGGCRRDSPDRKPLDDPKGTALLGAAAGSMWRTRPAGSAIDR